MSTLQEKDKKYVANTYSRFPVEIVSGAGSELYGPNGERYIDMGSGIGVTAFGTADVEWITAVTKQLTRYQHTSNLYYTDPCAELAKILCERTGMKKVFFGNSGAEANECVIKVMRKYASDRKGPDCYKIITLENSFHGRTLTCLAATGQDHFHELFRPLTPGFLHTPANDLDAFIRLAEAEQPAGILLEMIQGEGGVNVLDADFVQGVARYCAEHDILLGVDEVQTGNGRTGKLYSYMHYGITPDVVSTAKGLGGGLPVGACLIGEKAENTLGPGDHGSTFGGNPVACAGAVSILNRIDDALLAAVEEKGRFIREQLEGAPGIESVTGMGLMVGVKTEKPVSVVLQACIKAGVLVLTAKDKIRLLPALNIPEDLLSEALSILKVICKAEI